MNRHDEIQALARDIATNVHTDPAARDEMADSLIKLVGLMLGTQGKYLAVHGESEMNDADDFDPADYGDDATPEQLADMQLDAQRDIDQYGTMYTIGEQIQDDARELVDKCTNPKVDLDRWRRVTPGTGCRCGHVPSVHQGGVCTGEQYNREACQGGPCTGFVVREPEGGWVHVDRRPERLRLLAGPGTLVIPEVVSPELCPKCTGAAPCDEPDAGCIVAPPVVDEEPVSCSCPNECCYPDVWAQPVQSGPDLSVRACCYPLTTSRGHICHLYTGGCCYPNSQVCPDHH